MESPLSLLKVCCFATDLIEHPEMHVDLRGDVVDTNDSGLSLFSLSQLL
jgi:hypothetical protein